MKPFRSVQPLFLTGLLLSLAVAQSVAQTPRFDIQQYQVEGSSLISAEQIHAIVQPYIGAGRTLDDINAAADAIRQLYESAGYAVVRVFPPPQETTTGRIVLRVIEGEVETVTVKGNVLYDERNIRNSLPNLKEGTKPNTGKIVAAIAAANENPAKQVAVNFQSAEKVGNIDAVVQVKEDRPEKFTLSLDNLGNDASGKRRFNVGYQNANLFNRDHMVTVQVGTSDQPARGFQVSGGYRIPFYGTGLSLDAIASYSDSNSTSNIGFGSTVFNGRGTLMGLRLNQTLASRGEYRHRLVYGADYKDFDNACQGINAGTCGTVTAQPLSVAYVASMATPDWQASGNVAYLRNLPGGAHGSDAEYALARGGATADWSILRAAGTLTWPLVNDMQLRLNLSGQITDDRLIPSEQFGVGGAFTVRGYAERSLTGDRGVLAGYEVVSPRYTWPLGEHVSFRALVFLDYGVVSTRNPANALEGRRSLSATGVGLRGNWQRDVAFRLDVGMALDAFAGVPGANNGRERGDLFGHFGVNFQF